MRRSKASELIREFGDRARIVVYLAAAPGAGKTRRLLDEAGRLQRAGKRVVIGWIETKGRANLDEAASLLPRLPVRHVRSGDAEFEDFDFDAAVRDRPDVVLLDELAHANLDGAAHAKRWQDALALRDAGISVVGALNVAHVESAAPAAEAVLGYPVREIVPLSFLRGADEVVALDVAPGVLRSRVRAGNVVAGGDIERALDGPFRERTLAMLRELMLRTVDGLTLPAVRAGRPFTAIAFPPNGIAAAPFLRRTAALAAALDLALEAVPPRGGDAAGMDAALRDTGAELLREPIVPATLLEGTLRAALVAVPHGRTARELASVPLPYDLFIAGKDQTYLAENAAGSPYSQTSGDRLRVGYGKLTVYLAAAAGAGKTYAMLDRAQQLRADGIDVVGGWIETHGRPETTAMVGDLEIVPPKTANANGIARIEFDRDAVIARHPGVALVDELAHTNADGSPAPKRFHDVLALLRAGIDVVTTLNIQHLDGVAETIERLTGTPVRERLPDGILALADDVILIDVTPETLRARLREGKIYPRERVEAALTNFFRTDNLLVLRELALREALRARNRERIASPFERLVLALRPNADDAPAIARAARVAARLAVDFAIVLVVEPRALADPHVVDAFRAEARKTNVEFTETSAPDVARRILEIARERPQTTVALAGTRRRSRWLARPSLARRLLDAGGRELLVFASSERAIEREI